MRYINTVNNNTPVSFTNKTNHHDITEILLKVALNTITLIPNVRTFWSYWGKVNKCADRFHNISKPTLHSKHELIVSYNLFRPDKEMWIGMIWDTANQVHKWLDGDVVTWSPWTATEPSCMSPPALGCFYQDENYVRMTTDFYFRTHVINQLYDVLCESRKLFIAVWNKNIFSLPNINPSCSIHVMGIGFMVFHATFNNISAITWQSVFLVEETGVPGENHRPVVSHRQTCSCVCLFDVAFENGL